MSIPEQIRSVGESEKELEQARRRIDELEVQLAIVSAEVASFKHHPAWRLAKRIYRVWWRIEKSWALR